VAESSYLRYPHLARDLITFTAEDDVWLASLSEAADGRGSRAWRLTADRVPVLNPRLNPSATHVAWTSTRDGTRSLDRGAPREAYAVAVDGGPVRRLTYWGDRLAAVRGWVSDNEALVLSAAGQHASRKTWAFAVPLSGPARRLSYGPVGDVTVRENAVLVGSALYAEPARWKRYGGGTGGKIWYSPDGSQYERILADVGNHLVNPMFVGPRVVFLSDHEGTGALYSALPDGADLRRHTDLGEYYARHATTDGQRVVYQRGGEIWLLESLESEPVRLDIRLGGVRSGRASYPVSAKSQLRSFTLDQTGRVLGAEVRGTVHWLPGRDGPARALLAEPGVRGRLPVIIPGKEAVACASDNGGEDGLDVIPADGSAARRIGHGEFGRILELAVAPDGRTAAVACADGRLLTVALDGEPVITEIARSANAEVAGLAFSPDSALLAWSQQWQPESGSQIRLARLADGSVTDVTPARFDDSSPAFTLDGKYLAFLSNRAFDPVYDAHHFDLGFLPGIRPYLVTLLATTPSPFAPELNGRPVEADEPGKGSAAQTAESEPPPVGLDVAGLAERIVPFPVEAGRYAKLRAARDGVVWLELPRAGELGEVVIGAADEHPKSRLVRYDLAKRKRSVEVDALDDYAVSGDGARLAFRKAESLDIKPADGKQGAREPDGEVVSVDLDRIRVIIEPPAEWTQMYHEAWRLMRDNFWRADMAGVGWAAMGDRYRPLLDRIGSTDDLHDVLWELQGELGSSHAYVMPPAGDGDPALAQGLLGADIERTEDGTWRIARILPGESSVIGARSPLTAPGVAAGPGDFIVAVDGRPVDPDLGPNALLAGKADKPVELTLRRDGTDRRAVVVPLASEYALRYYDLIARRRSAVREASGGRLGYLHIPDMMSPGWAEFHRDLHTEFRRDGLIVDLRENGGGHTSQLVVEKLGRRIIGWDVSRYEEPSSYPAEAPRGPVVAIADENAGSDGDIVTQALKSYGIATVVGTRTWGGVIGIDMKYALVDGTGVTQPKYAFWFDDAGWAVENYGVDPDVEVAIPPHDWAAGRDPQLDTAVRLALQALEQRPPAVPPTVD
jgi:tricorn protease